MGITYVSKDASKEEIYSAYLKLQNNFKVERHHKNSIQDKVKEVRKEKNKKYNELRYQLLKKDQYIFKLNKHIKNLQAYVVKERSAAKKKGIEQGKSRVRVQDYSILKMHEFLMQLEQVSSILDLKLSYCAFILWAGRYDFFTIKDYKRDVTKSRQSFHSLVAQLKVDNFIVPVSKEGTVRQYALTATGIDVFNKLDKFTKKHFNG